MSVATYYDGFVERLVDDYQVRNRRVVAALEFAKDSLSGTRTLLDVGCGIGWTTAEMADDGKDAVGLDISPTLVATAREMFGDRCVFLVGDFADTELGRFDVVLMVDVYEHFARELRPVVHERLRQVVGDRLVLTVPTPEALQAARDAGIPLQPIDEDVTDDDIERLAHDIGGAVIVNRLVSVWADNDYRHVLVQR